MEKEIENAENNYNQAFGNFMLANIDVCRTRDFLKNLQSSYRFYQKEILKYKKYLKTINDFCARHNIPKSRKPWERIHDYLNIIGYYKEQIVKCQKQIVKTRALLRKYETKQNLAYNGYQDTRKEFTEVTLKDVVNDFLQGKHN